MPDSRDLYQSTGKAIRDNKSDLARISVDSQYAARWEDWSPYKQKGYQYSLRDSDFHFTYLSEAIAANHFLLFLDYVSWLKVFFSSNNFPPDTLTETLKHMQPSLQQLLEPEQAGLAVEFLEEALARLPGLRDTVDTFLDAEKPLYELTATYIDHLLEGNRRAASRLILDAVEIDSIPVREIYLHVFQPAQYEIGRLWQTGIISIAKEHFSTATTQMIISQLYPKIFATEKKGRTLVATCVGDELHEIGIRMVADFFEMDGWDTYFLGANTPARSIISTIDELNADITAISTTIPAHTSQVHELINNIRENAENSKVKLLVGGYPFNLSPQLWKTVGADGYARDAMQAIQLADSMFGEIS